jgi:formate dehydrogenase (NADP+) beta subunit
MFPSSKPSLPFGGLLRTGLPENRLPRDVLDWEIQGVLEAGVEAKTDRKLGRDFTVPSLLREGYSAVLVATGGWDTQLSERAKEGILEPLPGVLLLIDYLMSRKEGNAPVLGKNIMIVGGGSAALEAASNCLSDGAETVSLLFRTPRSQVPFSEDELKSLEQKGIRFHFQSALVKMIGEENRLTRVQVAGLTEDGKEVEGSGSTIPVDRLLIGAGRFPELIYVSREEGATDVAGWETLTPYASPFTEEDIGIFRPGEATGDYKAVVEAIGSGRRAANSIQRFITGKPVEPPARMVRRMTQVLNLDVIEPISSAPRQIMPERSQEERVADPAAEIALGYSEELALTEAKRCLQCGLICYRRNGEGLL